MKRPRSPLELQRDLLCVVGGPPLKTLRAFFVLQMCGWKAYCQAPGAIYIFELLLII